MERTESGAKVLCEHGGVARGQGLTASRRAEVVWPGVYTGAPGRATSMDAARWGLAWNQAARFPQGG